MESCRVVWTSHASSGDDASRVHNVIMYCFGRYGHIRGYVNDDVMGEKN